MEVNVSSRNPRKVKEKSPAKIWGSSWLWRVRELHVSSGIGNKMSQHIPSDRQTDDRQKHT